MKRQKGFTVVEGLLVVIALTLISFAGWYVWNANKMANESLDKADKSSEIKTDETIKNDTFKIEELGIQFKLPSELQGLTYKYDSEFKSVQFYMSDLDKLADNCEDKGPMTINSWSKIDGQFNEEDALGIGLIKQFDNHYIAASGGPSGRMCSDEKVTELRQKYALALNDASKTIETIN